MVVGQVGRDLVLRIDALPAAGGSARAGQRIERLGGKGANQAVGLTQLGAEAVLVGVVGADDEGARMLEDARRSGVDVRHVRRRGTTALLFDLIAARGERRLIEHVPDEALLTADDVLAGRAAFAGADIVCLQLQQPGPALREAARLAVESGARLLLDGAPPEDARDDLLGAAAILRADADEAALLVGRGIDGVDDAVAAAEELLMRGPRLVALGAPGGDVVAWRDGHLFLPFPEDETVIDPTGAGDAFVAGLVAGILSGASAAEAGRLGARSAASTVSRPGGRPDLTALRPR